MQPFRAFHYWWFSSAEKEAIYAQIRNNMYKKDRYDENEQADATGDKAGQIISSSQPQPEQNALLAG